VSNFVVVIVVLDMLLLDKLAVQLLCLCSSVADDGDLLVVQREGERPLCGSAVCGSLPGYPQRVGGGLGRFV
jgi:hypothetical protein